MSNLINITPVLPVTDIQKEILFFEKLGFNKVYDSTRYATTLDYAVMEKDGQAIHLQLFGDQHFEGQQIKIWVNELNSVAMELEKIGMTFNRHDHTPWETHEIGLYSPSNHAIFFVQEIVSS